MTASAIHAARQLTASATDQRVRALPLRVWLVLFFVGAALLRLTYLAFGRQDDLFVGWYIDGFHHWQIAYLTKEIGVFHGPRLWDFGGVEYFWGFVPTILDALLLAMTSSTALWPLQVLNVVAGSLTVAVLYLIGRRYWSHEAGVLMALFFAASPASILTDTSAMQEPVAFLFLALALYWFLERPVLTGLMLGLAAASRPDYWAYSLAILGCTALAKRALRQRRFIDLGAVRPYLLGYLFVMVPFVSYLCAQTGNPIYPLYWNFLGNAQGQWTPPVQPNASQLQAQGVARGILAIAVVGLPLVLWRKPRGWPVWMTGLLGAALIGYMLGISRYIVIYADRFWLDRIMLLLHLLIATVTAVLVARVVRSLPHGRTVASIVLAAVLVLVLSTAWPPALRYQSAAIRDYANDAALGRQIAALAVNGTVVVPGDAVVMTYSLVQRGVGADRLLSGFYHPPYAPGLSDELFAWFRRYDVRWLVIRRGDPFYETVIENEPTRFERILEGSLDVYRVSP